PQAARQWDRVDDAQGDGWGLLTELLVDRAVAAVDEVAFGRGDRPGPVVGEPVGRRRPRRHLEVEAEGHAERVEPRPEVGATGGNSYAQHGCRGYHQPSAVSAGASSSTRSLAISACPERPAARSPATP